MSKRRISSMKSKLNFNKKRKRNLKETRRRKKKYTQQKIIYTEHKSEKKHRRGVRERAKE